ncbi:MAG: hypothetical protein KatS3mg036_0777 [Ignavibacterium sp.]|nr:MAG: hypothetical protein KatS3mg036_0777 [Ignavibacterium sp.]
MKKIFSFVFAVAFAILITSCGGDEQKPADFSKSKSVNRDLSGGSIGI